MQSRCAAASVKEKDVIFIKQFPVILSEKGKHRLIHTVRQLHAPGLHLHGKNRSHDERNHKRHHEAEIDGDAAFPFRHFILIRLHFLLHSPLLSFHS